MIFSAVIFDSSQLILTQTLGKMETFDTDSKYIMAKIGMNENKAHVDEIHNIRHVHVLLS
jgi:hypothetical protein